MEVRPPRTEDCDGIVSPADPDARYNKHRGTGYLVQIMETFAEDDSQTEDESQPVCRAAFGLFAFARNVGTRQLNEHGIISASGGIGVCRRLSNISAKF